MAEKMPGTVSDKLWDAVTTAQDAGVSPTDFRRECVQAWEEGLRDRLKREMEEWKR